VSALNRAKSIRARRAAVSLKSRSSSATSRSAFRLAVEAHADRLARMSFCKLMYWYSGGRWRSNLRQRQTGGAGVLVDVRAVAAPDQADARAAGRAEALTPMVQLALGRREVGLGRGQAVQGQAQGQWQAERGRPCRSNFGQAVAGCNGLPDARQGAKQTLQRLLNLRAPRRRPVRPTPGQSDRIARYRLSPARRAAKGFCPPKAPAPTRVAG